MDFSYTDEQKMLVSAAADLFDKAYDPESRRETVSTALGWSKDVWAQCAEMGLLGLPFSEADGGMGAGPIEVMAVMTEVGRRLVPEPILDVVVVAGGVIAQQGTAEQRAEWLPAITAGERLVVLAHHEPGRRWPVRSVTTAARREDGRWLISGVKNPVSHGDCADTAIVSAALPDGGTGLFLVSADAQGVERTGYATHDGLRGGQWRLDSAEAEPLGESADCTGVIRDAEVRAQAGLAAEAVGAMDEALRLTTDYLKTRRQFGVPLATFQTLTQRAADVYVLVELARSMSMYASMSLADGNTDTTVASRVQFQICESARAVGQEAIQMHGGIGVTDEYPVSHYASRLLAIEHTLGGREEHLRVLIDGVRAYDVVEL
ncbi:acyl-CoA dehydrogenase family protein [Tomitella fengzijianii]|uniref:Acyl-CoA dehydrogenase n=1 Tax=Tomitella fengzijianii TaxID=2597660 RepID=A0A516X2E8_9ACTN|nr:acyl-CoA dehydrogenase [Tomitella fengzijianii]QDQ97266.1 acyl-CoA dehydrogenase [Tomitella fengzijianii]